MWNIYRHNTEYSKFSFDVHYFLNFIYLLTRCARFQFWLLYFNISINIHIFLQNMCIFILNIALSTSINLLRKFSWMSFQICRYVMLYRRYIAASQPIHTKLDESSAPLLDGTITLLMIVLDRLVGIIF